MRKEILRNSNYITINLLDNDLIIGTLEISKESKGTWYFNRLKVKESHRNNGYSKILMNELIDILEKEKIDLYLEINPYGSMTRNDLEKFYMSYGFKKISRNLYKF